MSDCACDICGGDHEIHRVRPAPAVPCGCEIYEACPKCDPEAHAKSLAEQPIPPFPSYPAADSKPLAIEAFPGELESLREEVAKLRFDAEKACFA